jgi:hypothetical protein
MSTANAGKIAIVSMACRSNAGLRAMGIPDKLIARASPWQNCLLNG